MRTRYARKIREAILAARDPRVFPYLFIPGEGFVPTRSRLYMETWERTRGNVVPPPPKGPAGAPPAQPPRCH